MTKEARDQKIRKLKDEIRERKEKVRELKAAKIDEPKKTDDEAA